jgi:hypothetical protein
MNKVLVIQSGFALNSLETSGFVNPSFEIPPFWSRRRRVGIIANPITYNLKFVPFQVSSDLRLSYLKVFGGFVARFLVV